MRVCIFTETFHPVIGGGETQARLLAEGLSAHGHESLVLTRRSDATLPLEDSLGPIAIHRISPTGRGQLKKWGLLFSSVPALLGLRHRYDLLFVSGFRIVGITAVLVARLLGKPVVLKADSDGEMSGAFFVPGLARFGKGLAGWPLAAFVKARNRLLRRADAFVAITAGVAAEMADARVDSGRVHRIANAVDTRRFHPVGPDRRRELRHQLGLPAEARIVTYTGRLVTYKGVTRLVAVWPRVLEACPDAVLLLVGTGGLDMHACEDELRASVREKGLEQAVRFTGSVQNVNEYLQASDLFAFPTENDAFPSSVIEAMTTGLPVVATPVGAIPEVLQHDVNGILVPPRDEDRLVHAIVRLLSDQPYASRLGRAAWQTVQDRYSAERVTQLYLELFSNLRPGPTREETKR